MSAFSETDIRDLYDVDADVLGKGKFGTVRRCVHKATGEVRSLMTTESCIPHEPLVDKL